jgi:hypothetical protein
MVEKAVAEASRCAPGGNVEKNKDFMSSLRSQLSSGSWPRVHGLLHARLLPICVRQLCEEARAAVKADGGNGPLQFMHCDYSQSNSFEPAGVDEVTPTETHSVTEKMSVSRTPREHDSGLTVAWVAPDEELCQAHLLVSSLIVAEELSDWLGPVPDVVIGVRESEFVEFELPALAGDDAVSLRVALDSIKASLFVRITVASGDVGEKQVRVNLF